MPRQACLQHALFIPSLKERFQHNPRRQRTRPGRRLRERPTCPKGARAPNPTPSPSFVKEYDPYNFYQGLRPSPTQRITANPRGPQDANTHASPRAFAQGRQRRHTIRSNAHHFRLYRDERNFRHYPSLLPLPRPRTKETEIYPRPTKQAFRPTARSLPRPTKAPRRLRKGSPITSVNQRGFTPITQAPNQLTKRTLYRQLCHVLRQDRVQYFYPQPLPFPNHAPKEYTPRPPVKGASRRDNEGEFQAPLQQRILRHLQRQEVLLSGSDLRRPKEANREYATS